MSEDTDMSLEGIWTGEFFGPYDGWESSGVYVLFRGAILGGSRLHYSSGTYSLSGNTYKAKIAVQYYSSPRAIFGEKGDHFEIEVTGEVKDGMIDAQVVRPDKPEFSVAYRMRRRMDLPAAWTQAQGD